MQKFSALVVEDDVAQARLYKLLLEETYGERITVFLANTTEAAAEQIGENDFAVIIHDLYLPPWGPESVARTYRVAKDIPIVAISGHTSPDLHRVAMEHGARIFCSKDDLTAENIVSILSLAAPATGQPDDDT